MRRVCIASGATQRGLVVTFTDTWGQRVRVSEGGATSGGGRCRCMMETGKMGCTHGLAHTLLLG
jgi:hypothetical protein